MEHGFAYDCLIVKEDDGYAVTFPQLPGAFTEGDTREEAIKNAAEALSLYMADYVEDPSLTPPAYEHVAEVVTVSISLTEEDCEEMRCVSFKQAAEELEVSQPRVSALVNADKLDVRLVKGRRMITLESINRYKASGRRPGRPRKDAAEG